LDLVVACSKPCPRAHGGQPVIVEPVSRIVVVVPLDVQGDVMGGLTPGRS